MSMQHETGREDALVTDTAVRQVPRLTWTMYAVIVAAWSRGSNVSVGCMPAAIATTIVSPIAREMPRMYAAASPGERAGHDDAQRGLQSCRPHRIRALAHVARHGTHRIFADRCHVRHDHDADHETGTQHVESRQVRDQLLQQRA
jgi:hypothetical protein